MVVGLVGRNGAGKTTTMRAIMGILRADSGEVTWNGRPITADDRLRFGYMPEERGLYPQMRIAQELEYFAQLHGLDSSDSAAAASHWIDVLGLASRAEERVVSLSHGNQQRVQLAVALVHDPELLVLDEPFAGLDPSAVDSLSSILREQAAAGTAVLFSSHQLELVEQLCDSVVILEEGRVLAAGTLPQLRARLPRRLRVKVAAAEDWAGHVPGASVLQEDGDGVLLSLAKGADAQAVLHAAEQAGPVEHFGFEETGLAQIYRQLVAR